MLLSYDGEVKLIDFGIAKAKSSFVKTVGVLKGKFAYMSPEQTTGKPVDRRSDIFSLGIVLYELVTGERLFVGDSDFAVLERVRTVDIQPPAVVKPDLPHDVEAVIMKALAKDVDERYQWCSEMRADLARCGAATTEQLSAWVRELFKEEISNEREDLNLPVAQQIRRSTPMVAQPEPTPPPLEIVEMASQPVLDMVDLPDSAPPPPLTAPPHLDFEEDVSTSVQGEAYEPPLTLTDSEPFDLVEPPPPEPPKRTRKPSRR